MDSVSGFGIGSDPWLNAALFAGLAALAISGVVIISAFVLRWRTRRAEAARVRVREAWQPRFAAAAMGDAIDAVRPGASQIREVLELWNHHSAVLRGAGRAGLARYGGRCGFGECALGLLRKRGTADRLLALATFGHLADAAHFGEIETLAGDPSPTVSLAAARALIRIDPKKAVAALMRQILARPEWPIARIAGALRETPQEGVADVIAAALAGATEHDLPRLLALARAVPGERIAPQVRVILERSRDAGTLAAALALVSDPRCASLVRRQLSNAEWPVRLAAVRALARIATPDDLPRFTAALADREWWVRQRAADALARLPFFDAVELERLRQAVSDRYAKDALARALAERDAH